MRYGLCSLLKGVRWPIVVNVCVIWALMESCLICNYSTSSFLYIMLFNLHCTLWYRMVYNMLITTVACYRIDNGSCCLEDTNRIFIVRWAFLEIFGLSFLITKHNDFSQKFIIHLFQYCFKIRKKATVKPLSKQSWTFCLFNYNIDAWLSILYLFLVLCFNKAGFSLLN